MSDLTHFDLVGEFHDTFGHPQRKELYEDCFESDSKLIPFRISLMYEELKEFKDAYVKQDLIEMADALADLSYVTNGSGHTLGINLIKLAEKMMIDISTPKTLKKVDANIFETNPDFIDEGIRTIEAILDKLIKRTFIRMFCSSSEKSEEKLSVEKIGEYLVLILAATYNLAHSLGFNMDCIFREVHRSNMTKVCTNIEDAEESVKLYEEEKRYKKPSIRRKGQYFVVYDAETSKILKNHKWENPNIKQFF
jgi:predicted HAD superfamily Cof-like phosphohydrolase